MNSQQVTRRERRIAARKQQILEAALTVFLARGYNGATTREIAEAADIAEGTIYNYFASKEDILLELISSIADLEDRQAYFDASLDMDFREFLMAFSKRRQASTWDRYDLFVALVPALVENPEIRRRYEQEIVTPAMQMMVDHFQKRIDRGQLKPIENLDWVIRIVTGASFGLWFLTMVGDPVLGEAVKQTEAFTETALVTLYDQFIRDDNVD